MKSTMPKNYLNIKVTFDERYHFNKFADNMRATFGDDAFGHNKHVESLIEKIKFAEES